jgi:hypothetical protein
VFRLCWVYLAIVVWTSFPGNLLAQVPFQCSLEYKQMPQGTTQSTLWDVAEVNGGVVAVGSYQINGGISRGFIFDRGKGPFTDVFDLIGFTSSCRAISSQGIVIGNVSEPDGTRRVYWLNYFANPPTLNLLDQRFPLIGTLANQNAVDINIHGATVGQPVPG